MNIIVATLPLASNVANIVDGILSGLTVVLIAWVVKILVKLNRDINKVSEAMFPPGKKSLPDMVEQNKDDLQALRIGGTDRLREILVEARVIRQNTADIRDSQIEDKEGS